MPTSISTWVDKIRGGNLRALSRAIAAVQNRTPESHPLLQAKHDLSKDGSPC